MVSASGTCSASSLASVSFTAEVAELAGNMNTGSISEVRPLIEKDAEESQKGESKLFWLHDTTVMGWKEHDEPAMVAY